MTITPKQISASLLAQVESASGKPVIVQQHSDFSGHATLRLGPDGAAANVLFYKPALEAELPYLTAFQCKLVLRSLEMKAESRFNLEATGQLKRDVERMVRAHLQINSPGIPEHLIPQLCSQFAGGLGVQLRSMPIAIRVDAELHKQYPELRELQRVNIDRQLDENLLAFGASVKPIAPREIIDLNASMNAALARYWARTRDDQGLLLQYLAAGYGVAAEKLLAFVESEPNGPDSDRDLVDAWRRFLKLEDWFQIVPQPA